MFGGLATRALERADVYRINAVLIVAAVSAAAVLRTPGVRTPEFFL